MYQLLALHPVSKALHNSSLLLWFYLPECLQYLNVLFCSQEELLFFKKSCGLLYIPHNPHQHVFASIQSTAHLCMPNLLFKILLKCLPHLLKGVLHTTNFNNSLPLYYSLPYIRLLSLQSLSILWGPYLLLPSY